MWKYFIPVCVKSVMMKITEDNVYFSACQYVVMYAQDIVTLLQHMHNNSDVEWTPPQQYYMRVIAWSHVVLSVGSIVVLR